MPRALASAWPRPNRESWVPWMSRVGASIRSSTVAGLLRSRTAAISGVSVPVAAAVWYAAQMSARNRPHSRDCSTSAGSSERRGRGRAVLRDAGAGPAGEGVEQPAGGHRSDAEEQPRPQPLVDAGVGVLRRGGDRSRVVDRAGLRREERGGQGVPGDLRGDRVDAVVVAGAEQGQRPAVGAARDADPGVAVAVLQDLVALGQQVEQGGEVGDLVAGVVQPDLPGAAAEPARGVGEDDVAAAGEVLRVGVHGLLAATEPVREHDRRRGRLVGRRREVEGGVELDGVRPGTGRDERLLGRDVLGGGRRRGGARADQPDRSRGSRATSVARAPERGRERTSPEAGRTQRPTVGGRNMFRPPAQAVGSAGQGCQSPAATTTRPGAVTSAGSSKKRGAGPGQLGELLDQLEGRLALVLVALGEEDRGDGDVAARRRRRRPGTPSRRRRRRRRSCRPGR